MNRIRNFALAALVAVPVVSAAPSIGPSHFVNYVSPDTFIPDVLDAATAPGSEMPSRTVLAACGVLGILIVKASRE